VVADKLIFIWKQKIKKINEKSTYLQPLSTQISGNKNKK
jgi:hypothetical protein